jgi:hypothetical protein
MDAHCVGGDHPFSCDWLHEVCVQVVDFTETVTTVGLQRVSTSAETILPSVKGILWYVCVRERERKEIGIQYKLACELI